MISREIKTFPEYTCPFYLFVCLFILKEYRAESGFGGAKKSQQYFDTISELIWHKQDGVPGEGFNKTFQ